MITIRHELFETNSSSCHVYVYFPKKDTAEVPATVKLIPDDESTPLQRAFNDNYTWIDDDPEGLEIFLARLLVIGVKNIRCSDKKVEKMVKKVKECSQEYCSRDFDKEVIGRKVWWRSEPGVITHYCKGQAAVIIEPDGIERFTKPREYADDDFPIAEDIDVKADIFDKHIWWFRKENEI